MELDLNLDDHYPNQGHTECKHQSGSCFSKFIDNTYLLVRGKSTMDKIILLLCTWPVRAAADISVTNKLISFKITV